MLTNKELTRVEPRAFVRRMLRDFDRFFEEGWTPFAAPARVFGEFAWTPTLEVVEKNQHLVARFELPGMKKEEITVTVAEGTSASVSVSTFNGEFASAFPVTLTETRKGKRFNFTVGGGAAQVTLESFQGTIELVRPGQFRGARGNEDEEE